MEPHSFGTVEPTPQARHREAAAAFWAKLQLPTDAAVIDRIAAALAAAEATGYRQGRRHAAADLRALLHAYRSEGKPDFSALESLATRLGEDHD